MHLSAICNGVFSATNKKGSCNFYFVACTQEGMPLGVSHAGKRALTHRPFLTEHSPLQLHLHAHALAATKTANATQMKTRLAQQAHHLLSPPRTFTHTLHTCTHMHSHEKDAQMYKRALRSHHHLSPQRNIPRVPTLPPVPHLQHPTHPFRTLHTNLHIQHSHTTQYLQRPPSAANLHAITLPPINTP